MTAPAIASDKGTSPLQLSDLDEVLPGLPLNPDEAPHPSSPQVCPLEARVFRNPTDFGRMECCMGDRPE